EGDRQRRAIDGVFLLRTGIEFRFLDRGRVEANLDAVFRGDLIHHVLERDAIEAERFAVATERRLDRLFAGVARDRDARVAGVGGRFGAGDDRRRDGLIVGRERNGADRLAALILGPGADGRTGQADGGG